MYKSERKRLRDDKKKVDSDEASQCDVVFSHDDDEEG
jgi:hypothetical protein